MSKENVEIVRRGYEAYERGDLPALIAQLDSGLVTYRAPPFPDAGTYHAPEGMMRALLDWAQDFDEFAMTGEEFIDAPPNQVLVRVHQRGSGIQSGAAVEGDFWFVHTVRGGKWTRVDMYMRNDQALEAAGLSA